MTLTHGTCRLGHLLAEPWQVPHSLGAAMGDAESQHGPILRLKNSNVPTGTGGDPWDVSRKESVRIWGQGEVFPEQETCCRAQREAESWAGVSAQG